MQFEKLWEIIIRDLKPKLETNQGLAIFAKERAKFEAWLKVELCGVLSNYVKWVCPEKNWVDVVFDNWAIELKTLNTNYRYSNVKNKNRPITNNTHGVNVDIKKLQNLEVKNKAVLFVVFPVEHENENWQVQLRRIEKNLAKLHHADFLFNQETSGVIYFGLV